MGACEAHRECSIILLQPTTTHVAVVVVDGVERVWAPDRQVPLVVVLLSEPLYRCLATAAADYIINEMHKLTEHKSKNTVSRLTKRSARHSISLRALVSTPYSTHTLISQ